MSSKRTACGFCSGGQKQIRSLFRKALTFFCQAAEFFSCSGINNICLSFLFKRNTILSHEQNTYYTQLVTNFQNIYVHFAFWGHLLELFLTPSSRQNLLFPNRLRRLIGTWRSTCFVLHPRLLKIPYHGLSPAQVLWTAG